MKVKWVFFLFSFFPFLLLACTNPIVELARPKKEKTPAPLPDIIYTVAFESNGGSPMDSQTVTEGKTASRPAPPKKDGYGFDDWYKDRGLTTLFSFDTKITAHTTVYAWWKVEGMEWIRPGTFMMGSPESETGRTAVNETQHSVTLTKGFYMGKYPVTQARYEAVIGTNPSGFTTPVSPEKSTANRPVERVSWYDALVFCNKLSMAESLSPAYQINGSADPAAWGTVPTDNNATWNAVQIVEGSTGYRLPTEAQWEYACRAGTTTAYNWGMNTIDETRANYEVDLKRTTMVGSYAPNNWGLYDMHGNVWEWCWDWYDSSYYSKSPTEDPTGPGSAEFSRITRGGSMGITGENVRSAVRNHYNPSTHSNRTIGFRVIRP
jgi:formylglycine-generating enzyme required for sulfatase activity